MSTAEKITEVPVTKKPEKEVPKKQVLQKPHGWEPFGDFDRMFGQMVGRPFSHSWVNPFRLDWPFHGLDEFPRVDVVDRDHEVVVRAEVPGVDRKDLEISLSGNTVTFRGNSKTETEEEKGVYHYRETSQGSFYRTVTLPAEVDDSNAKAKYKEGVVELTLPKVEAAKRKRVEIETAA